MKYYNFKNFKNKIIIITQKLRFNEKILNLN